MRHRLLNRTWISPLTSVTFLTVAITGILMAFHVKSGGIKAVHEWIGYAFSLMGVIHLVVNWKSFVLLFRERSALLAVLAGVILSLAVLFAGGTGAGKAGRRHPLIQAFDLNGNGTIDADEIAAASASLNRLDANGDGRIAIEEIVTGNGEKVRRRGGHGNRPAPF